MFTGENVSEADNGYLIWDKDALFDQAPGRPDSHQVIDGLDGCRLSVFSQELLSCVLAFLDRASSLKDKLIIPWDMRFPESQAITFQPIFGPRGRQGAGKKSDFSVPETNKMPRRFP